MHEISLRIGMLLIGLGKLFKSQGFDVAGKYKIEKNIITYAYMFFSKLICFMSWINIEINLNLFTY